MLDEKLMGALAPFAWPFVALIALFTLRPYISKLTEGVANLKAVIENNDGLTNLVKSMTDVRMTVAELPKNLTEIKETVDSLQGAQETLLNARSTALRPSAVGAPDAEALWLTIDKEWELTKEALRRVAKNTGIPTARVQAIGSGTSPLQNVTDELVNKETIARDVADKIVGLSKQWQWMRRTNPLQRQKFLDEAVAETFKSDATFVREQLFKITS